MDGLKVQGVMEGRLVVRPAEAYHRTTRRRFLVLGVGLGVLGAVSVLALAIGRYPLSVWEVLRALFHAGEGTAGVVIWHLRLPRIVAALVGGAALGLSGMLAQTLLRNPLASPFTLGVSQGAAFGAALAIVVFPRLGGASGEGGGWQSVFQIGSVSTAALIGAMVGTVVILGLARFRKLTPTAIVLAGVALASLFMSGTILIQYFASEEELAQVVYWTFGDVGRPTWGQVAWIGVAWAVIFGYCLVQRWTFNVLDGGDEMALALGIRVGRVRMVGMFFAALGAALVTAFCGIIGYLGLMGPHIGRLIGGGDHRFLIPFSSLAGAFLLVTADTVGRVLVGSGALPVGVLTSFLGAPLFLFLLLRSRMS